MKKGLIVLLLVTLLFAFLADRGGRESIVICASSEQYRNDALQEQLAEAFPERNIMPYNKVSNRSCSPARR